MLPCSHRGAGRTNLLPAGLRLRSLVTLAGRADRSKISNPMPTQIEWPEIALRLLLALAAGLLIGLNRSRHGHAAGLRTTMLVCLAATVAMLQVNVMLATGGRKADSFIMLDLMRLPLGILSGIGFIGAGAILRKGDLVQGVTTAATLWFVTVIGLCLGGGQIGLGLASFALALVILGGLPWFERRMSEQKLATLTVLAGATGPTEAEVRGQLQAGGFMVAGCAVTYADQARSRSLHYDVRWRARMNDTLTPPIIAQLAHQPGVQALQWRPSGAAVDLPGGDPSA
jgi:putative Mg2+ transporter-C (MgtC) family protein